MVHLFVLSSKEGIVKYFIKTDNEGKVQMLLKERHPLISDFIEIELTNEQYNEILKEICRYKVENKNNIPILKYVPKTPEEIAIEEVKEQKVLMNRLRKKRQKECFSIVNRGQLWYRQLSEVEIEELNVWYQNWLDVTETLNVPEKPSWLKEENG